MRTRGSSGLGPIHVARLAQRNGWTPRRFGTSTDGIPLLAWWPRSSSPTRVVWGAIHGEESVTMQALHQALRTVHADDATAVVVPVLNPDGVLLGTRQNANGIDLNRNFPTSDWSPEPSPTFWPTTTVRRPERRTQLSSPGPEPGSESETQAIMQLVERVAPSEVVDFHTPLECVIAMSERAVPLAERLALHAELAVVRRLEQPTPGDSARWCEDQGAIAVTYEFELAPLPSIWARHRDAVVDAIVGRRRDD